MTGNVQKLYPAEAHVTVNGQTSKAMPDLLTTASKRRRQGRIGRLGPETLNAVEHAIKIQLDFS